MKRNLLIAFVLFISITSCKKEKPPIPESEERKPEVIINEITTKLAGADSISTFTAALKKITLTTDETAQGITVFAPLNQSPGQQARSSRMSSLGGTSNRSSETSPTDTTKKTVLTDSELRDHIVKGVFNFADLTNGRMLTGLNGNQLKVTRVADTVWINGIRIGGKQIMSSGNEAVYAVKSILTGTAVNDEPQSTSLEITVWDATQWSAAKPKGDLAIDAWVSLYLSQKDYADSIPAIEGRTDINGKIIFKKVSAGVYYIKVTHGSKSNIFNRSAKQNGLYAGYANAGVFQNQSEINAAATQAGAAPGDFKWVDVNADGVINNDDRITLPYEKATVVVGALRKAEVMIGSLKNTQAPALTETEFNSTLSNVESNISIWHKRLALIDGILSPKAPMDSIPPIFSSPNYLAISTFTANASNQFIKDIWTQGYESITTLTTLQELIPTGIAGRTEKIARIRATRAYIYLQLLTYYGNISLQQSPGKLKNNDRPAVYNYITTELREATAALPSSVSGAVNLNAHSVRMISAKAALLDKKYQEVADLTQAIIDAGRYTLASKNSQFNSNSSETMWENSVGFDQNFKTYFYNRATMPYLRLTEVYLMNIEANIALNNTTKAQAYFDLLFNRAGYPLRQATAGELRGFWADQMPREGNLFASMLRWGISSQYSFRGFVEGKHNRLPIPQSVIDANENMLQNPGY